MKQMIPLSAFEEVSPLCEKGHIVLVRNREDGALYVKKRVCSYNPEIYQQLWERPVAGTPTLYGVYRDESPTEGAGTVLTVIEEYCPGETMAERLAGQGLFSEEEAARIGAQLCRILMDLHSRRPAVIHRDIKPANVQLLPDGSVRLLDFSASKPERTRRGPDTVLLGTAGFAAPEQYGFSSSTPQTDLYAVGVLLNMMVTGRLPREQLATGKLRRVIARCLRLNPKERYAGAWELHRVLCRVTRVKAEWLLPGFRTLHPLKMLAAFPVYVFLVVFSLGVDVSDVQSAVLRWTMQLTFLLLGLAPILFYGNYLDLRRWFPLMRSPRRVLRVLGMILAPFLLWAMVLGLSVLLQMVFSA